MPAPTEWLSPFQVNTGSATTGGQTQPKIVGLANGTIVVVWQEGVLGAIGTAAGTDIIAQRYSATGEASGDPFRLNSSFFVDNERDFDLTATHDGFAIAYVDDDIDSANASAIRYERFNLAGFQIDSATIATETTAEDDLRNPQISANLIASNDDVYVNFHDNDGTDTDINARVIDQDGLLGAQFASAQNSADPDRLGDVAVLTNGNFVTVYEETDAGVEGIEFVIRTPAGIAGVVASAVAGNATDPAVTSLAGGGFVVTYTTNNNDVFARTYSNTGVFQGQVIVASGPNNQNEAAVVALTDGGYVIAWDDDTNSNLFARRFNADGTPDGARFTVENANTTNIDVGLASDGRILFTWQGDLGEIFASIWDPRPSTIDPDDYMVVTENFLVSRSVTTGVAGSTVLAGPDDSIVLGQDGDDTIFTASFGRYFGGGGNDTIHYSGASPVVGLRQLSGGTGVDTLNMSTTTTDQNVNLATGDTNFPVEVFTDFENIVLGSGNDTVTGTAGANVIETGNGADTINAGNGNDTILAGAGNDIINAGGGNDTIEAGAGNDVITSTNFSGADQIFAGSGNDTITSSGEDTVFGEAGNDTIFAGLGAAELLDGGSGIDTLNTTLFGFSYTVNLATGLTSIVGELFSNFENIVSGNGSDTLFGTAQNNVMSGRGGNDQILGYAGDDSLQGGNGNDTLNGGEGNDFLDGGGGADRIFGGAGADDIVGGIGNDLLVGLTGDDGIVGGLGNDILRGAEGDDFLEGGDGDDAAYGGDGTDNIAGDAGNDTLNGSGGNDFISGGSGNDLIIGEIGEDILFGDNGNDIMRGGGGDDVMDGGSNDDLMFGSAGEDFLQGGDGNDTLEGNAQADELFGENGNDILRGGDGFDFLDGGAGNDILVGGNGKDILVGGFGMDILRGNAQADTFVFGSVSASTLALADIIDGIEGVGNAGGDVIDVSGIDANSMSGGNQSFTFLGNVSNTVGLNFGAGGLWVQNAGGQTRVFGNTDNDTTIEFAIRINDGSGITASDYLSSDFIL
ncbi:MAG: calcium-binding protein [Paracoccaceae bacterium]|nr:calcium-binding protein [Paracoccaceae bacterium]